MRYILIFIIYAMPSTLLGQSIWNYTKSYFVRTIPDIYVYNNNKDTIYLTTLEYGDNNSCDTVQIIDSIQLNGVGKKEIVFYRSCSSTRERHGGSYDISESVKVDKYEIWDIDRKQVLFEAVSNYNYIFNNFMYYHDPMFKKGTKSYTYDISFKKNGQIIIKNLKNVIDCNPDHEVGVYKFLDGKYVKE